MNFTCTSSPNETTSSSPPLILFGAASADRSAELKCERSL